MTNLERRTLIKSELEKCIYSVLLNTYVNFNDSENNNTDHDFLKNVYERTVKFIDDINTDLINNEVIRG